MADFIADSCVWIDFLRGKLPTTIRDNLVAGMESDRIRLTDIILHEILVGAANEKKYAELKDMFSAFAVLRINSAETDEFTRFAFNLKRQGLTGKYTDISIAYLSRKHDLPVLSFDAYFHELARAGWIQAITF